MEEEKQLVWLDCDPGHDDAFAIILAGYSNKIKLLGISTALGNQSIEKTTQNALKVLSISGLDHIDVVRGQAAPLIRPPMECPEIHGNSGLDCGVGFPPITKTALPHKAVLYMYEIINAAPSPVTIVATACLTNIAVLITVFPEIKQKIKSVTLLGGAIGVGNMSPSAEWNILVDPEAAKLVFDSGMKIVMVPIEVSHTALATPDIISSIQNLNSNFGLLMVDLLLFFKKTYKEVFNFEHPPLHDPLAIAYVISPDLFETRLMRVDVETMSPLCSGRTVVFFNSLYLLIYLLTSSQLNR
eukprot:TRINITY_DN2994_c0_g1_i3.p1 TRINITY_DN2994_c0_g1~~TRINITY_DN2994_c0_g1_i3.p1  ORF type:complete len:299 (-),score=77.98 TRINITY_DN2994_c0_g1_i3:160-1056(-)